MPVIKNFINCFFPKFEVQSIEENDICYKVTLSTSVFTHQASDKIIECLKFLQEDDRLTFTIVFGEADPISYYSGQSNIETFLRELVTEYTHQNGEPIVSTLNINKNCANGTATIYELTTFVETLKTLTIAQCFVTFDRILANASPFHFKLLDFTGANRTSSIIFSDLTTTSGHHIAEDRNRIIESHRLVTHYSNYNSHRLTPDDFKFASSLRPISELERIFNRNAIVLAIIYLFDITSLKENTLEYILNGYRSVKGTIDGSEIDYQNKTQYYDIYKWVYDGGNLTDKIGLARNIISLHLDKSSKELGLIGNPMHSIQSSYKIYEKQNIQRYLELRSKISEQLVDFSRRASRIIDTFASGFQKSAIALMSFYTSVIAIRILSGGNFSNVFSIDMAILSVTFVAGSLVYYFVSRWEVVEEKNRFINSYQNLRERYTDLLDNGDIDRILNNDREFKDDINFIDKKRKYYSCLWITTMVLLILVTLIFYIMSYQAHR